MTGTYSPYKPAIRLFVHAELAGGTEMTLDEGQSHYLANVMRQKQGAFIELFNGRDGSWQAELVTLLRKSVVVRCVQQTAAQQASPDLWLLFAPVKRARLDFMAQKATELGVSKIWPVDTEYCQMGRVKTDRLEANAIEAAEQTVRQDVPDIGPFLPLQAVLVDWPEDRVLIFCDEGLAGDAPYAPLERLAMATGKKAAILIGPEGGFSPAEREMILSHSSSLPIHLGPRILRSDTAALSALSLYQAVCGDWRLTALTSTHLGS